MERKRIDLIACTGNYKKLSSFTTVEELNQTVRTYRDLIRMSVKRADVQSRLIALLEILKRHSCKYVGVSFLCKNTIADMMEVSYKTVQRLMKKLVDLGIIKQFAMKRHTDMNQTANAIVIQSIKNDMSDKQPAKKEEKCPTKTTTPSLKQNIKDINKRNNNDNSNTPEDNIQEANFIAHWVPDRFINLASCFYTKSKTIQELWKVVKQCNRVVNYTTGATAFNKDQELEIGVKAIKEFVMKVKAGMKMKLSMFAYFNGIVNNLMDKYFFDREFIGNE